MPNTISRQRTKLILKKKSNKLPIIVKLSICKIVKTGKHLPATAHLRIQPMPIKPSIQCMVGDTSKTTSSLWVRNLVTLSSWVALESLLALDPRPQAQVSSEAKTKWARVSATDSTQRHLVKSLTTSPTKRQRGLSTSSSGSPVSDREPTCLVSNHLAMIR